MLSCAGLGLQEKSGAPRHFSYKLPEMAYQSGVLWDDVTIEILVIDRRKRAGSSLCP